MKKMFLVVLAAVLACVPMGAGVAQAAVAGSAHDMSLITFGGGWGGQGVCSYCHVPHAAQGARLWAAAPLASVPVYGASVVAGLCYTCHDGTALTTANHQGSVYNAGEVNHVLADTDGIAVTNDEITAWPWTAGATDMECSSCHNPHDNTANQFLRDVPFAGTPTAITATNDPTADSSQFCNNCHQGRTAAGAENARGAHPVGAAVVDGRKFGVTGTVDMVRLPYNEVIDNTATGPGVLGGHLSSYATGGAICNTCHMPHGAAGNRVLTVSNSVGATATNGLCQDCHGGEQPSLRFAVNRSIHPVNTGTGDGNTVNGAILILDWDFTTNLESSMQGTEGNGNVVCLSCHKPHQAQAGTPILRTELRTVDGQICNDCHSDAPVGGANHPSGDVATADITNEDTGTWPNNDGLPLGGASSTRVVCDTCHAAHDGDAGAIFMLRIRNGNSEICNGCHTQLDNTATDWTGVIAPPAIAAAGGDSANPSGYIMSQLYAGNNGTVGQATHQGTHAAYRNVAPAAKDAYKVALTAAVSGRSNSYGTNADTITCESCHLVHGADVAGGWHGSAGSANILFLQNGNGGARSGVDGGAGAYNPADDSYCSACHAGGANPVAPPGTHPVQAWTVTRTNAAVNTGAGSYATIQPPTATADYTAASVMTCESCHAPHAADTGFGSFCLEGGTSDAGTGGTRPNVRNRDALCLKCHVY